MKIYDFFKNQFRSLKYSLIMSKKNISGERPYVHLYSKQEIKNDRSLKSVLLIPCLTGKKAPTVILCPGGAYKFISCVNEGYDFAEILNEKGFNAFILKYRVGKYAKYPAPMEDLSRAISFLKHNSERYDVDVGNIFLCGASAGGHLCGYFSQRYSDFEKEYMGKNYSLRPCAVVLAYPVVSMENETHELSRKLLLGENPTREEMKNMSVDRIASENYPPAFFWHCEGDKSVPISNSRRLNNRLTQMNVFHKYIEFQNGAHGIGLGKGTVADGWFDKAIEFLNGLCE